jgi:hypothetical protein
MGFTGDELEDEGADPDHEENEPLL